MDDLQEESRLRERCDRLLKQLQQDADTHAATEALLRRLVQRLCLAARGLGDPLDPMLDRVIATMREPVDSSTLEPLLSALSNAIAQSPPAVVVSAQAAAGQDSAELRKALAELIDRLELDETLRPRALEIRGRLESAPGLPAIVETCAAAGELVGAQRERLQLEKADVQRILLQVDTRLHELVSYLRGEAAERRQAEDSRQQLDAGLLGEVRLLTDSMQRASSLDQLRTDVGLKLEAMDRHLQVFRAREVERTEQHRSRAERMRARVEQLEHETRALQASLQREQVNASTDALTGISNRLAYDQRIALEYKRWKRFGRPLSIAVWDIDHFKAINDRHGHRSGDRAIRAVGRLLARQVRETDFVARYGGEEFVAILVDARAEEAMVAAEKLRRAIQALRIDIGDGELQLTVSCGIAEFRGGDQPDQVFERADRAMYAAKQGGRNRCVSDPGTPSADASPEA